MRASIEVQDLPSAGETLRRSAADAMPSDPIAKRGAERLREGDGGPIKSLDPRRADHVDRYGSLRPVSKSENPEQAGKQN